MEKHITVITGGRGAGKTRYCLQLLEQAERDGIPAAGIISPAVYADGLKTAFFSMDVRTGERRLCGERSTSGGTIGCWKMDPAVMEWSSRILRTACPCRLLFIDEIGPLELVRNEGFTASFDILRNGSYDRAFVVVRPECLDLFRERFPEFDTIMIGEETCTTGPGI